MEYNLTKPLLYVYGEKEISDRLDQKDLNNFNIIDKESDIFLNSLKNENNLLVVYCASYYDDALKFVQDFRNHISVDNISVVLIFDRKPMNFLELFDYIQDILFFNAYENDEIIKKINYFNSDLYKIKFQLESEDITYSTTNAVDSMLSMIAHQWRQPLNRISTSVSSLELDFLSDSLTNDTFSVYTKKINDVVKELSVTIDDFRGYFAGSSTKNELNLKKLLLEVESMNATILAQKRVQLILKNDNDITIVSEKNALVQAITNIMLNSIDEFESSPKNDATIWVESQISDTEVQIVIKDNGRGIKEENLTNIFKPYFSTKKQKNGVGLGLYLSKSIINKKCTGTLSVSNTNDGAKFTITLPRYS